MNHSNNAIVKPPEMTPQAAAKELETVMKRVREAQSTIAAAIEPGMTAAHVPHHRRCRANGFTVFCRPQRRRRNATLLTLGEHAARRGPDPAPARVGGHAPNTGEASLFSRYYRSSATMF